MKKKVFIPVAIFALSLALIFAFGACVEKKTNLELVFDRISTRQTSLYVGADDNFNVSLSTSQHEDVFIADGQVGKQETETLIKLSPKKIELLSNEYKYCLIGADGKLEGVLEKDRLGASFSAALSSIEGIGKIVSVTVTYGETSAEITLGNKMEGAIAYDAAVGKAYEAFKEDLDAEINGEGLNREVYVRYVNNCKDGEKYFWYVSFIAGKNDYMSVMLDPVEGAVVSRRKS